MSKTKQKATKRERILPRDLKPGTAERELFFFIKNYLKKSYFKTTKLGNYFSNNEKIPHELKFNVVVDEYKCFKVMDTQYIGFTFRRLIERPKEYLR